MTCFYNWRSALLVVAPLLVVALVWGGWFANFASAQDVPVPQAPPNSSPPAQAAAQPVEQAAVQQAAERPAGTAADVADLQFNFDSAPWRDVIQWLAEDGDLALHVRDMPTGSFTYADPRKYTNEQAIQRVNLFLLGQGYTLVQSGRMLSVINLEDPRSMQQLDALAQLVPVDELDKRSDYDVVKCIFPLEELKAEDAVAELSALKLLTEPAVFNKTNRILVTDTVRNLKSVKAILDAFEPQALNNGTIMATFPLKHVSAEDVLVVARPHLGLATDEMIGIDVSLSADLQGKNIIVTGVEDKVKLIETLVTSLDKADNSLSRKDGEAELKSHAVRGGNVETVYNVLVTLLAKESVRLSMDKRAEAIVALASPAIQQEIEATVKQLEATEAQFEVIPLKSVDPYFAITLIEQMLDLPGPFDATSKSSDRRSDDDEIVVEPPKIDADPGNKRLFVRGKQSQIDQIKKIVEGLDGPGAVSDPQGVVRIFPVRGEEAKRLLKGAASFWRGANPVIFYPTIATPVKPAERVVAPEDEPSDDGRSDDGRSESKPPATSLNNPSTQAISAPLQPDPPQLLSGNMRSAESAIRCQVSARGLMIQCEDAAALGKFYALLEELSGPAEAVAAKPVVFYLKYAKPTDAIRMLAEMLDGGEAAKVAAAGTLVNGLITGSSSTYLGSLVSSRDGTTTMTAGTITVVAESRLNRLIAQGTESDIGLIEGYLEIIDKQKSLTAVETYGKTRVIELKYARATEVADAIREAFAGRVGAQASGPGRGGAPGQSGQQPAQAQQAAPQASPGQGDNNGGKKAPANAAKPTAAQAAKDLEPKLIVAVHEASNSLIITAPEQLFEQVEELARQIDARNEIVVEIFPTNVPGVAEALQEVLGDASAANRSRSTPRSSSNTPQQRTDRPSRPTTTAPRSNQNR